MSTVSIKNIMVAILVSMAFMFAFTFVAETVSAQDTTEACAALQALGETCTADESTLTNLARNILNILSMVVGIISVIMIVIGGFRYVVSGGDSSSVQGAKNTIIYAIVGLVIVVFAQAIVAFVLGEVGTAAAA